MPSFSFHRTGRRRQHFRVRAAAVAVCATCSLWSLDLSAKAPVAPNLAGGLDTLVQSRLNLDVPHKSQGRAASFRSASGAEYAGQQAARLTDANITATDGRVMVMVKLDGLKSFREVRRTITAAVPGTGQTDGVTSTSFTQADLFGGTLIPAGMATGVGMTFSGTTTDGGTLSGTIRNNIGAGWSVTDGFGFINTQTAVDQTAQ